MAIYLTIDDHQTDDAYQFEVGGVLSDYGPIINESIAVFPTVPDGGVFVPDVEYRIWKERGGETDPFRKCFTFVLSADGGVTYGERFGLPGDTSGVTLNVAVHNGDWTDIVPRMPNLALGEVDTVTETEEVYTRKKTSKGYEFALIDVDDLASLLADRLNITPLPAYRHVRIWRARTGADPFADYELFQIWRAQSEEETLPAYRRIRIWRAIAPTVPNAPSNLSIFLTTGYQYKLRYTDNSNNETSFEVEWAIGSGAFTSLGSIPPNETESGVLSIDGLSTYRFRVRAVNAAGASAWSNTATLTPQTGSAPAAPTELSVFYVGDNIRATWRDNANSESAQTLFYRVMGTQSWTQGPVVNPDLTQYDFPALANRNVGYNFYISASNSYGTSSPSNIADLDPPLFLSMRARVVPTTGSNKRVEIEAITSQAINPQFLIATAAGQIGGYFPPFSAAFGTQTYWLEYDSADLGSTAVDELVSIRARNAANTSQVSNLYAITVLNLNQNWTTLLIIS